MECSFSDQRSLIFYFTAQKMKFSIKDFFSKCGQIRRKLRIGSHLLKKNLLENPIFCAVFVFNLLFVISTTFLKYLTGSRPKLFGQKVVFKNIAKCIEKHLRRSLFFDKVAGLRNAKK